MGTPSPPEPGAFAAAGTGGGLGRKIRLGAGQLFPPRQTLGSRRGRPENGRASCRERGEISGGAVSLKKKRGTRSCGGDWTSDVCYSDLVLEEKCGWERVTYFRPGKPWARAGADQ